MIYPIGHVHFWRMSGNSFPMGICKWLLVGWTAHGWRVNKTLCDMGRGHKAADVKRNILQPTVFICIFDTSFLYFIFFVFYVFSLIL